MAAAHCVVLAVLVGFAVDAFSPGARITRSNSMSRRFASGPPWAPPVPEKGFGLELELLRTEGTTLERIREVIEGAGEPVIILSPTTTKAWKLMDDPSLPERGFELVSPILRGSEGRGRVGKVIKALNEKKLVVVDKTCGFHLHIDVGDIRFQGIRRICQQFAKYEDAIDLILPPSRRGDVNRFCNSVRKNPQLKHRTNKQVNDWIGKTPDQNELLDRINPKSAENPKGRYYKMNLRTGENRTTIEFRGHSGTYSIKKIKRWINLLVSFVENSNNQPSPKGFQDCRDAEYKFHRMFQWLTRGKTMYTFYDKRRRHLSNA